MKRIFFPILILSAINCSAQKIPAATAEAFAKTFPNTSVKKWDKEDGNYEANFSKDGKIMAATFDANGNWLETETDINISQLPLPVAEYIAKNYAGEKIKEAAIISNPQSKKLYEAEVKGNDLLFDENGNFIKEQKD